jgi:ribosomal protein S18 acetylase RimI-like enzyme
MKIRAARPDDAGAIAEASIAARAEMTYLPRLHTDDEDRGYFRDHVVAELEVWVAELEGEIAGFVALEDDLVEHLYVAPPAQGRGIGSALLAHAKARRPEGLQLWVFQQNLGARRFYERHAFELVRLTDGTTNEEREPDALYAWPGVA